MGRNIAALLLACVLVGIGLVSGWYAARQGIETGPAEAESEAAAAPVLSEQALRNIGVTVADAVLSDFVRHTRVQATVVDPPLNTQPVAAPLGGIVTALHVEPGDVVEAGARIATIAREPIPRPQLALTADILTPVSENLHASIATLRTAASQRKIIETELERIREFTTSGTSDGLPILPPKTEIDLRYDLARASQEMANARRELERHGLSAGEVDAVQAGELPPGNKRLWKRALEQNALWGEVEEAILKTLPPRQRDLPWSIAAIGELSAAGLANAGLLDALMAMPQIGEQFVDVASLLLQGNTVAKVRILADAGALKPEMVLRAPRGGAPDFDVAEASVRLGVRVSAGDTIAVLHDARTMWLRLEPLGEELRHVVQALREDTALRARPLLEGTGPELTGLKIDRLETRATLHERGARAYVVCPNEVVHMHREKGGRSWRLRVGLRYLVEVPVEVLEDRFVLPAGAVTEMGPERVVFVRSGSEFQSRPVHVEYEDEQVAVVANDGAIFEDEPVAMSGAFALGLALQTGPGAVDPHAGHNHG